MAIQNPPGWLQNLSTHNAAQLRMYTTSLLAANSSDSTTVLRSRGGIHPTLGSEFNVTQAGSPNMTVLVESGMCSIPGTESSTQGNYFAVNDAQVTLSIAAAHATLPRIDAVVVNIRDAQYSGASNDAQLQVITGTPASSPSPPTLPNNSLLIAYVDVLAAVTSITNANISDRRHYLAAAGGVIKARSLASIPGFNEMSPGQLLWTNDTGRLYVFDGSATNQIYPGFTKIAENVLGSAAASVTFSSIPGTFKSLQLHILARGDTASTSVTGDLRFNGDSTSIYNTEQASIFGSTVAGIETLSSSVAFWGDVPAASATAGAPGIAVINIPWYANTSFWKTFVANSGMSTGSGTGQIFTKQSTAHWRSTAAVTSIFLRPGSGNFVTGSSFVLYGLQ